MMKLTLVLPSFERVWLPMLKIWWRSVEYKIRSSADAETRTTKIDLARLA